MKRILLLLVLCASFNGLFAQQVYNSSGNAHGYKHKKVKGYDPSRLIIGGTINAGYSSDYANFGLGPTVGYKFTDMFSAGLGLGYQFYKAPFDIYNDGLYVRENLVYPSIWAKFNVFRNFFIDGDFEYNFINVKSYDVLYDINGNPYLVGDKFNTSVPCLLLGVGIKQPIGGRVSSFIEIMYDVLQQKYSPYANIPVFRAGITTGL